jgi:hypothetical protein
MMTAAERRRSSSWTARALLSVAALLIVLAGWSIVAREAELGGALLLAGAVCLVGAAVLHGPKPALDVVLASLTDRLFDGVALATIAWAYRYASPATAAGAMVALGTGFLSAYIRVRGAALGYGLEEALATRVVGYALVSIGLLVGWIGWSVWALAGFTGLAAAIRASQVAKEERA